MALFKKIEQSDGVITDYHRILFLQTTVNQQNSIAVLSYVSSEVRDGEKKNNSNRPYMWGKTYETDYDPDMTIEEAYEFLKTLPEFKDAENV